MLFTILCYVGATFLLTLAACTSAAYALGKRKGRKEAQKATALQQRRPLTVIDVGECVVVGPTGKHWLRRKDDFEPLLQSYYVKEEPIALAGLPEGKHCHVLVIVNEPQGD